MEITKRPEFHFLDGIRGLCAIYIAMYHAKLFTSYGFQTNNLPAVLKPVSDLLSLGHFSISFFIVLSGFCLTIPVAKSAGGRLNGGTLAYIKRRARRILPPYYFALDLSIFLIIGVPLAVGASYLFFMLVEKRYTTMAVKTPKHSHSLN